MFSIAKEAAYEEQIRRSRFIGHLARITTPEEAKDSIASKAGQYRDASHNCWAYITGMQGETFHFSDAGEPSGTAGKPILTAMQRHDLSNVVMVVTRYFGGVKLGIRGLIEAYRHIAEKTIAGTRLDELILKEFFEIVTDYAAAEKIKYDLQEMNCEILSAGYQEKVTLLISIPVNNSLLAFLKNAQNAGLLNFKYLKTDLEI